MGSTDSVFPFEQPLHEVTISAFRMDTTLVTQADYASLASLDSAFAHEEPTLPIQQVTWYDAALYCNARSRRDGFDTSYSYSSRWQVGYHCMGLGNLAISYSKNGYRLPTEAEWEYACRAGTRTEYYWGDSINGDYCWYGADSGNQPQQVAEKLPNAWGLYDMSGNLWEWCNDWYALYPSIAVTDPVDSSIPPPMSCAEAPMIIFPVLRSACRALLYPPVNYYPTGDYGFRCVRRATGE